MDKQPESAQFDEFAEGYEIALERGIAVSGERKDYFAEKRVVWLKGILGTTPMVKVLDFGCGTGSATPFLLDIVGAKTLIGVDVSEHSLQVARKATRRKQAFLPWITMSPMAPLILPFVMASFITFPSQTAQVPWSMFSVPFVLEGSSRFGRTTRGIWGHST